MSSPPSGGHLTSTSRDFLIVPDTEAQVLKFIKGPKNQKRDLRPASFDATKPRRAAIKQREMLQQHLSKNTKPAAGTSNKPKTSTRQLVSVHSFRMFVFVLNIPGEQMHISCALFTETVVGTYCVSLRCKIDVSGYPFTVSL